MKKPLLLVAVLAMFATTVSAQNFRAQRIGGGLDKAGISLQRAPQAKKMLRKAASANANQRVVGYYVTEDANNAVGVGSMTTDDIQPAVYLVPSDYQQYAGAKVVGMRFAVGPSATVKGIEILGVSASGNLTSIASKDTTFASTSPKDYSSYDWNTVMLPKASQFTLNTTDYAGLMVSYKCTQGSKNYPVATNTDVTGRDLYIYCNVPATYGGNGLGWYSFGSDYGAPAIQLILENDNFPKNGVTPMDFAPFTALVNSPKKVNLSFYNLGTSLKSFDYTVTVNGVTSNENHVDLATELGVGGTFSDSIAFTAPAEAGTYEATVNITKVNGVANEAAIASSKGTMVALTKAFKRGVVVEEFTGTGCGYCPRGLAGMKKLAETYPDNFVGVGIHQYNKTDPMYDTNYADLGFTGAPSCMIDRNGSIIDPYYGSNGSITTDFAKRLEDLPVLGVDVDGQWNSDSTAVTASATIDPLVSGNYNIDFVLVADSLTGSSSAWNQSNYYAQYSASQVSDPDIAQFCTGGAYGKSSFKWPFDDVLISSSYTGTTNKATLDALTEGTKTTASYTLQLPTSKTLASAINKKKVYVIAIVYDENGVANAAKGTISGIPTAIKSIDASASNAVVVARYNAAGQRVNGEQKGLNIVKLSNGKVVKYIK